MLLSTFVYCNTLFIYSPARTRFDRFGIVYYTVVQVRGLQYILVLYLEVRERRAENSVKSGHSVGAQDLYEI
jgi:hypothetical protein